MGMSGKIAEATKRVTLERKGATVCLTIEAVNDYAAMQLEDALAAGLRQGTFALTVQHATKP